MLAKPTGYIEQKRKTTEGTNTVFKMFFKGEDGKSYWCWLDPKFNNFNKWHRILHSAKNKEDIWLDNLIVKGKMISADSLFIILTPEQFRKRKIQKYGLDLDVDMD